MNRVAVIGASCMLLGAGILAALGGCGSDEAVTDTPDADVDGTGSSTSSSGGSTSSSSSSSSSSTGGLASNPGKVTCGASECDSGINAGGGDPLCCWPGDASPTCVADNGACPNGHRIRCDEPLDCNQGRRCCLDPSGGGGGAGAAECSGTCNAQDELDLCKDNTQCGDGGTCRQVTCNDGGRTYRTCQNGANTGCL